MHSDGILIASGHSRFASIVNGLNFLDPATTQKKKFTPLHLADASALTRTEYATGKRCSFAKIASAGLVQTKGLEVLLCSLM